MGPLIFDRAARSLRDRGYARLKDDGRLSSVARTLFHEGEVFFDGSGEMKGAAATISRLEGYRPLGAEFSESSDLPDLCESFSVWAWNESDADVHRWAGRHPLHTAMSSGLAVYASAANAVLHALRMLLNPRAEAMDVSGASYLQINHYRPRDFAREFLQEVHEDGHVLTFHKATHAGLEIRVSDHFEPVEVAEDEFLLLPGSLLALLTGGAIQPLFHRVRNDHSTARRQSCLYFVNPDVTREVRPWIENATNRGVDIREVALSCIGAR